MAAHATRTIVSPPDVRGGRAGGNGIGGRCAWYCAVRHFMVVAPAWRDLAGWMPSGAGLVAAACVRASMQTIFHPDRNDAGRRRISRYLVAPRLVTSTLGTRGLQFCDQNRKCGGWPGVPGLCLVLRPPLL